MPAFNFKTADDFNEFFDLKANIQVELNNRLYCKVKSPVSARIFGGGHVVEVVPTKNHPSKFISFDQIKAYHVMCKPSSQEDILVVPKVKFTLTYQKENDAWELSGPRTNYWMPTYILKRDGGIIAHLEKEQVFAGLSSAAAAGRYESAIVFMKYMKLQVK